MTPATHAQDGLGDFTTTTRMLRIAAMAAVVGAIGACVAWVLVRLAIQTITALAYFHTLSAVGQPPSENKLGLWAVLVLGIVTARLIVGLVARFGSEKIRGHGIPEAMEAILIGRSRLSAKVAVLKPTASAIAIGTGGPFGAEGPIIMTGAAFGSVFAQAFHLSDTERKTLLVAGAAAGMAAIFSAPVAAVLLAVELLLFEWKPSSFVPVAVAATIGRSRSACRCSAAGGGLPPVVPHAALSMGGLRRRDSLRGRRRRTRIDRDHKTLLRVRGRIRQAADPLDVVARYRRRGRRCGRALRAARARRRL